ncbi:hypothetical protein LX99_00341 [Mucilaginibacter oryzae]|uniref:Glycosyl transferase family 2 n=1 Tax=Mucilaginibacter oryzae TaxID=468058 RepID=A0A316HIQ8_9SPHI|nr:hypothetical protein [Mucilaginibacter oryzae]PWK79881.1 hypothetical protein LX99_00341 [Mucilaginibacter oryzae]
MKQPVSLQISLAPGDYRHALHLLPHQLKQLHTQVDEIILTVDTLPGRGRFAAGWAQYKDVLDQFLRTDIMPHYNVKVVPVDYTPAVRQKISRYFFGRDSMPVKDFRGGPFYAYFFGLHHATNNLVFHLDSDMFLGGGSKLWVAEAVQRYGADNNNFVMAPLPGPPRTDDTLTDQQVIKKTAPFTWQLGGMSTRIFLIDKSKFDNHKLILAKPSPRNRLKALIQGHDNADLPEHLIADFIKKHQLKRVDFLGDGDGMWSLHPPYRTENFYEQLPAIIKRIENNDLPENQRGFYDLVDEVCDWTEAREKLKRNRWWKPQR